MTNLLIVLFTLSIIPGVSFINWCLENDEEIIYVVKRTIELQKARRA